jgi:hypothetical protein
MKQAKYTNMVRVDRLIKISAKLLKIFILKLFKMFIRMNEYEMLNVVRATLRNINAII